MTAPTPPEQPRATTPAGWPPAQSEDDPGELGWPGTDTTSDEPELEAWLAAREGPEVEPAPESEVAEARPGAVPPAEGPAPTPEPGTAEAPASRAETPYDAPEAESDADEAVRPAADEDVDVTALVPRVRSRGQVLLAVLVAVLAGLTAFLAVAAVRTRGLGPDEEGRRDALAAARNAARLVFSYDYRRLDKDFAAGLATTTGDFRAEYTRTTTALTRDGVPSRYKAVVVADVSDAAVVTADDRRAQVLVFLDQQSTSTLTQSPKITQSRVAMTLVYKDGRWLVEEIDAL